MNMENQEIKEHKILKIFFPGLLKMLVLFILAVACVVVVLFLKGFHLLQSYCDGFFVSGAILLTLGFFSLLGSFGAFDSVSYLGYTLGNMFRPGRIVDDKPHMNLVDYVDMKKEKRAKNKYAYVPYFEFGILFVFISFIILLFI